MFIMSLCLNYRTIDLYGWGNFLLHCLRSIILSVYNILVHFSAHLSSYVLRLNIKIYLHSLNTQLSRFGADTLYMCIVKQRSKARLTICHKLSHYGESLSLRPTPRKDLCVKSECVLPCLKAVRRKGHRR